MKEIRVVVVVVEVVRQEEVVHVVVASELSGTPSRGSFEVGRSIAGQPSQPHEAEIHELRVLDIAKIRWISENCVQALRLQFNIG